MSSDGQPSVCPTCRRVQRLEAQFCSTCGASLTEQPESAPGLGSTTGRLRWVGFGVVAALMLAVLLVWLARDTDAVDLGPAPTAVAEAGSERRIERPESAEELTAEASTSTTSTSVPAATLPTHEELGGILGYGDAASGEIVIPDDFDLWLFEGQQDDIVTIEMATDELTRNVAIELRDSSGRWRADANCTTDTARVLNYELRSNDTYSIRAQSCNGSTGPYTITLTKK